MHIGQEGKLSLFTYMFTYLKFHKEPTRKLRPERRFHQSNRTQNKHPKPSSFLKINNEFSGGEITGIINPVCSSLKKINHVGTNLRKEVKDLKEDSKR